MASAVCMAIVTHDLWDHVPRTFAAAFMTALLIYWISGDDDGLASR